MSTSAGGTTFIPFPVRLWLASSVHYDHCRCARCKELKVNGHAPKTSMELHYNALEKIEKENTR